MSSRSKAGSAFRAAAKGTPEFVVPGAASRRRSSRCSPATTSQRCIETTTRFEIEHALPTRGALLVHHLREADALSSNTKLDVFDHRSNPAAPAVRARARSLVTPRFSTKRRHRKLPVCLFDE